jgi:hypothetical protein
MKLIQLTDIAEIKELAELFRIKINGSNRAVKTEVLLKNFGLTYSPQTLRRYLGYIRQNDLSAPGFIVSNVNLGYWYTECPTEKNDFLQRELNRIASQYANIEMLHRSLKSHKSKQETTKQIFIEFSETNQYQTI